MSLSFFGFLVAAFFAETVGTVTGFGATTILVPVSAFFIPLKSAIVLVALFHFFGTLFRSLAFRKGINWRVALTFGLPSLIFSAIGASLLAQSSPFLLSKILGVVLIIYALNGLFEHRLILPQNPFILSTGGAIVGFLAGLIGTAGALRGAFLTSWSLQKNVYLGTGAVMGLGADLIRVFVYQRTGLLELKPLVIFFLAVTALLGTLIGRKVVGLTKQAVFAKIVFVALILAGLRFLLF